MPYSPVRLQVVRARRLGSALYTVVSMSMVR